MREGKIRKSGTEMTRRTNRERKKERNVKNSRGSRTKQMAKGKLERFKVKEKEIESKV